MSMTRIDRLCRELGAEYSVRNIDWERCLYRDFGNGFNVEISNIDSRRMDATASIYLWFGTGYDAIIVKTEHDVERTAAGIHQAVERLLAHSNALLAQGLNTRDKLFLYKNPELRKEETL